MLKELLTKNPQDKIISICWGLIIVSVTLFSVYIISIDKITNIIIIDDYFFGFKINFFYIYYLVDIVIILCILSLLKRKITFGVWFGIFWSLFNLLENIFDIPIFISDLHMIFEELVFILLYAYLLILFIVNYKHYLVSSFKQALS